MASRLATGTGRVDGGYAHSENPWAWHTLEAANDAYFAEHGRVPGLGTDGLPQLSRGDATTEQDEKNLLSSIVSVSKTGLLERDGPLTAASTLRRSTGAKDEREEFEALVDEFFQRMDEESI